MNEIMAQGSEAESMKDYGRNGDSEMAHVTPGEIVVPLDVQTPQVLQMLQEAFQRLGIPMERYIVGDEGDSMNPSTGEPEYFGGIGKFLKKKVAPTVLPIAGAAVGNMIAPGIGGKIGGALGSALGSEFSGEAGGMAMEGGGVPMVGGGVSPDALAGLPSPVQATIARRPSAGMPGITAPSLQLQAPSSPPSAGMPGITAPSLQLQAPSSPPMAGDGRANYAPTQSGGAFRVMPVPTNPSTGYQEFYGMGEDSRNPHTGMREYAGLGQATLYSMMAGYQPLRAPLSDAAIDQAMQRLSYGAANPQMTKDGSGYTRDPNQQATREELQAMRDNLTAPAAPAPKPEPAPEPAPSPAARMNDNIRIEVAPTPAPTSPPAYTPTLSKVNSVAQQSSSAVPNWYNNVMSEINSMKDINPAATTPSVDPNANAVGASRISPVRAPRFRSNRYAGSYAPSF